MTVTKEFPTLDVVTVATGFLVSDRGIDAVYELTSWMLQDSLMTHQLPAAFDVCKPYIEAEHPWIAEVAMPAGDKPAIFALAAQLVEEHGKSLILTQPEDPAWNRGNAITDLEQIADGRPIIQVQLDPGAW